jgi:tripeptide aminopeptidase
MAASIDAAASVNQQRLIERFTQLAQINAPSGNEKPIAEFLAQTLEELGFAVEFDVAHEAIDGKCGNLIAWWPGTDPDAPPLFFSTHMDTVLPTADLQPVIRDGFVYSDGTTILGADDRAALAAYLEGIQALQEAGARCGPIELILTVSEQAGLLGARHLDYSKVRSHTGYIFDSSGDVGQIILKGPYSNRLWWEIAGKMSHLGLAPEEGVSAILIAADALTHMKLGKVDANTNANVGIIHGGELASIIPDRVEMVGEVRCFTAEGLQTQVDHMIDAVAASARRQGGRADVRIEEKYVGWQVPRNAHHVQVAIQAAERIGVEPYFSETLGGADTNIFIENGLECFTLGLGFRDIHSFEEHISIENLVNTARLVTALVQEFHASQ